MEVFRELAFRVIDVRKPYSQIRIISRKADLILLKDSRHFSSNYL